MKVNQLYCILGPTAIGKTALGISLAQHFDTSIISADSRQFFKEMKIGTAVPDDDELTAAKHYFIQHISVTEDYSVGHFERNAIKKLDQVFQKKDTAIMVGGSGLYVKAITEGLDDFPEIDSKIRKKLNQEFEEKGIAFLQEKLKVIDPEYYQNAAIDNPHRVIRALEVSISSEKTFSSFLGKQKKPRNFNSIKIGLTAPREIIYSRIEQRVDKMMELGLLDEAKKLHHLKNLNALNTVGYKELFRFLDGEYDLETAINEIKKNTRRFAKRQLTWFRKQEDIRWFDYDQAHSEIIAKIEEIRDFSS
ncbi:MAG: tRNA (adenosine(37)-N6)-dimethylallyltransferase MiaA [Bacteroidota bacterium]